LNQLYLVLYFYDLRLYLWEILHLTIRKMSKHVSRLGRELAEARERLRHAESDSDESEDGDGEGNNNASKHGVSVAGDDHEKPSEDMVDRMEERLEAAQADQKNLFLIVFQARL
jgi:nuclear cap-binding protein subunit 1